ncbi:hypothetical protein IMSHALPRED_008908 [Imshaugia aleurites]|uniref:Lytic polysaccharide monooxygenase n=1 Tax=Imshaugia aleurites TaxID=172621 RepID=A0A8H3G0V1_9LECA|nr:hypothetical protein IMSHALPRED_008908 [Imshaugia aleurites]
MHFYTLKIPTWLILVASFTDAHVKLDQPVPYGAASLNTNPLETDGSDWPCKQRPGVYDVTQWNIMPINSLQTISFQGQATHGGGSCQISLSRHTPPSADSVFKVIKSIEGGCPSSNPGNVGTDPFGYGADEFNFTIPDAIAPANYTLAWTWFNKIGDREMYMNCVPVIVTPSSSKNRHRRRTLVEQRTNDMDSLPDMFRANSGNGCSTAESGTVLAIPPAHLGENVQRIGSDPLTPPVGNCGGNVAASASQTEVALPSSAPSASEAPTSYSTLASTSAAPLVSQTSLAPTVSSESPAASPSILGSTTGSCSTPGKSVCSPDGTAWGTCMEDYQVIFQPVAVGTKCDLALGVEVPARRR